MQKLKCIIVDDEEAAIKVIRTQIKDNPQIEIIGEYQNPIIAFQNLKDIDLLFLDITFQDYQTNGVKFINSMNHTAKVIIVSGTKEHAHEILDFYGNVVFGYLIKPVDALELTSVIDKVYKSVYSKGTSNDVIKDGLTPIPKLFRIKISDTKGSIEKIFRFDEILFFKGAKDFVEIHTKDKMYLTPESLKDLLNRLPKDLFMETHRSFIINITNIDTIEGNEIFFRDTDREKKRASTTNENKDRLRTKLNN